MENEALFATFEVKKFYYGFLSSLCWWTIDLWLQFLTLTPLIQEYHSSGICLYVSTSATSITGGRCWQAVIASITHHTPGSSPAHIIYLKRVATAAATSSHVTKQMHTLAVMLRLQRMSGGEAKGYESIMIPLLLKVKALQASRSWTTHETHTCGFSTGLKTPHRTETLVYY